MLLYMKFKIYFFKVTSLNKLYSKGQL